MENFWKEYRDLPAGSGYGHFSLPHVAALLAVTAAVAAALCRFGRLPPRRRQALLRALPWLMLLMECGKDAFLLAAGRFGVGYLPLHLCSMGIFVFLAAAFSRREAARRFFGEVAVTLILPASAAALLFPDWTALYPLWNFLSLYSYVWHALLVLYPLLLLRSGGVDQPLRHIWYDFFFLACVTPPVYLFDLAFACNYLFLLRAPPDSPLEWIARLTGERWYPAGYAALTAGVIGLLYLGIWLFGRLRRRPCPGTEKKG